MVVRLTKHRPFFVDQVDCYRCSVRDCMSKIEQGDADMITLDAADVYVAGK